MGTEVEPVVTRDKRGIVIVNAESDEQPDTEAGRQARRRR